MGHRDRADAEIELAFELLDTASEAELDRAIGNLVSATAGQAGPGIVRAMRRLLTEVAREALPIVASVATEGAPWSAATARSTRNGARAGRLLGLELEGLSPEDQELELARQFVRVAVTMGEQAALTGPGRDPAGVARAAAAHAARRHAPGLAELFRTEHQWKEDQ
jgi:hypothetical protein